MWHSGALLVGVIMRLQLEAMLYSGGTETRRFTYFVVMN